MVEADTSKGPPHYEVCRLCLENHDVTAVDIFEEQCDEKETKLSLVQRLFDLVQIKYEKSSNLPNCICQRCLFMVDAFYSFRENVQTIESKLQARLELLKNTQSLGTTSTTITTTKIAPQEDQRPGLNGNPGTFELDENCIITEVDPDQEYESSDDDFSMESDSETEEVSSKPPTSLIANAPATQALQESVDDLIQADKSSSRSQITPMDLQQTPLAITEHTPAAGSAASGVGNEFIAYTNAPIDSMALDFTTKNTFLCQYCDMAFTTQQDCTEHETRHDISAPYVCNFCPLRTASRPNLIYHIKEAHDPERPYVCALCNKGFCRRSDLKKHTIVHTGVRPFTCPVCAKSFSRNTNLTKHMRIHSSIKPHVCQRCPRSFTTASELLRHARSHAETKPFQCSRCSASFTRKDKLQLHEQAHYRRESEFLLNQAKTATGAAAAVTADDHLRSFNASGGGQMENIVVALNPYGEHESQPATDDTYRHSILATQLQHQRTAPKTASTKSSHSRLFTCDICAKSFTRERDLQRHQALHLDSLFTCKQCGTGFNRREKLVRHEQEHHGPQYPCKICRIAFPKKDSLEMHLKMHELQQSVAMTTQAALSVATGMPTSNSSSSGAQNITAGPAIPTPLPRDLQRQPQRPSAADMSFYSQMVPTMNLGFYSETRPEDHNEM